MYSEDTQAILDAAHRTAKNPQNITVRDLALYDELHVGARKATEHLFAQLEFIPDMHVLDVGSGLGGVARHIAELHDGISITGIDLSERYCVIAREFTNYFKLSERLCFDHGNAAALPYDAEYFDAAYTLHVAMNIEDKQTLYDGIYHVLKPGAWFAVYDVLREQQDTGLTYPLPWAPTEDTSFLVSLDEMKTLLEKAGFQITKTNSRRNFALKNFQRMKAARKTGKIPETLPVRSADYFQRVENLAMHIEHRQLCPWEIICKKPV